jgi:hypothetical protein
MHDRVDELRDEEEVNSLTMSSGGDGGDGDDADTTHTTPECELFLVIMPADEKYDSAGRLRQTGKRKQKKRRRKKNSVSPLLPWAKYMGKYRGSGSR